MATLGKQLPREGRHHPFKSTGHEAIKRRKRSDTVFSIRQVVYFTKDRFWVSVAVTERHHILYTGFALWIKVELELRSRVVGPFQRVCLEMP